MPVMNENDIKQSIRDLLHRLKNAAPTAGEIATQLELRGKERKRLQKWLKDLMAEGDIVNIRGDRYALGMAADLVVGRLETARSGRGFVTPPDGGPAIVIPAEDVGVALPGDRVMVRLNPGADPEGRRSGRIIRVTERGRREIVGTLRSTGRFLVVAPLDPAYKQVFYVPDAQGAAMNDRVVIRFTAWDDKHVSPEAEVVEVIGPSDDPSLDTRAVMRHFGLRERFPEPVLREAETVSALVDQPGERLDLRERLIITIDPERARDFDDALSLERDHDGHQVLGVHIADVSHFVRPGSDLDEEAFRRGTSVYFPDGVLPMLPEQLSNGVCSLKPAVERLAFSVFITYDDEGRPIKRAMDRSRIRSGARLTYEQAYATLRPDDAASVNAQPWPEGPVAALVRDLHTLAARLRARRFARYALELDMPENEIVMGADGRISDVRTVRNDIAHQLVEECMVAANEAVAEELLTHGVALISRVHEEPSEQKIEDLTAELSILGFEPGDLRQRRNMAGFLKSVGDHPLAWHVRLAVLRSMKRARYAADTTGHFGLAKKYYAHFTSPIRRYPDLVVHRQLAAFLAGRRERLLGQERLGAMAETATQAEWTADDAERAVIEIKKFRFLEQELKDGRPRAREAVVVKVTNFGVFVELLDLQMQGLVHVSRLSDQFLRFDATRGALGSGKQAWRVGRRVTVVVSKVDFENRRVDFEPAPERDAVVKRARDSREAPARARPEAGGARPHRPVRRRRT